MYFNVRCHILQQDNILCAMLEDHSRDLLPEFCCLVKDIHLLHPYKIAGDGKYCIKCHEFNRSKHIFRISFAFFITTQFDIHQQFVSGVQSTVLLSESVSLNPLPESISILVHSLDDQREHIFYLSYFKQNKSNCVKNIKQSAQGIPIQTNKIIYKKLWIIES